MLTKEYLKMEFQKLVIWCPVFYLCDDYPQECYYYETVNQMWTDSSSQMILFIDFYQHSTEKVA